MMRAQLPWPPSCLSPNARIHWAPKRAATAKYRADCAWASRAAGIFDGMILPDPLPMTITFCPPNKRRRDRDNLIASFKAGQDGLSDAIGLDDSRFVPTYRVGDVVKGGAVLVEIGFCQENKGDNA